MEVVEIAGISETSRSPRRMIDPLPNLFSMPDRAASIALPRSTLIRSSAMTCISFFCSFSHVSAASRSSLPSDGAEHNTSSARMEQCFTLATGLFSGGLDYAVRRAHGSPLCVAICILCGTQPLASRMFSHRTPRPHSFSIDWPVRLSTCSHSDGTPPAASSFEMRSTRHIGKNRSPNPTKGSS